MPLEGRARCSFLPPGVLGKCHLSLPTTTLYLASQRVSQAEQEERVGWGAPGVQTAQPALPRFPMGPSQPLGWGWVPLLPSQPGPRGSGSLRLLESARPGLIRTCTGAQSAQGAGTAWSPTSSARPANVSLSLPSRPVAPAMSSTQFNKGPSYGLSAEVKNRVSESPGRRWGACIPNTWEQKSWEPPSKFPKMCQDQAEQ